MLSGRQTRYHLHAAEQYPGRFQMPGLFPASVALACHSASPTTVVSRVTAGVTHSPEGGLRLKYVLTGNLDALLIPTRTASTQASGLWQHTCFEAFIAGQGSSEYCEFNFSPSTQWAAYGFSRYRQGMAPLACDPQTPVSVEISGDQLQLEATITCMALEALGGSGKIRMSLAAIVEERTGRLSYWAIAHPSSDPDFHHPDSFVLHVDRPERAVASGRSR